MILSFGAEGWNIDLWDNEAQLVPEVKILFKMILGDKAKTFKDKPSALMFSTNFTFVKIVFVMSSRVM